MVWFDLGYPILGIISTEYDMSFLHSFILRLEIGDWRLEIGDLRFFCHSGLV
ncbi:predicted protein [Sclerotinia sclerotiorum 1980 UF-70]|uniref:Uncharacterized protein n=1 Tax=Sclerotinia sclerotiorum (strain ATCC 18683 / 1980 / Ss-1) TaxID=665079 RepID=A7ELF8_SCLS1|nr:predicted protein [Sclerotinia sclerotiorum 1980 UF-70]EDO03674.1 predicted protein [Sclerotinia sclerotiorum 1980 UF-70]